MLKKFCIAAACSVKRSIALLGKLPRLKRTLSSQHVEEERGKDESAISRNVLGI